MTDEEYIALRDRINDAYDIKVKIEVLENTLANIHKAQNYDFDFRGKPLIKFCNNELIEDLRSKIIAHIEGEIKLLKQEFKEL